MEMKKNWKRIGIIALAFIMVTMLLPLGSFKVHAEEGEDESEALGATYKVGDIIKFGHYEQDGNTANGKEEIEWQVLKLDDKRAFVVSKYVLDNVKYHETSEVAVTWETCSLRKWLNNDFMNLAFSDNEKQRIPSVEIENKGNAYVWGGNNTIDKVFCLSFDEIYSEKLFGEYNSFDVMYRWGSNEKLICTPTQYAINRGAQAYIITQDDYNRMKSINYSSDIIGRCSTSWWLRSPGHYSNYASTVSSLGGFDQQSYSSVDSTFYSVRPAMYVDLPVLPTEIKLNKTVCTLYWGGELTLSAILSPSNVTEKTITWTSSNPAVATVNNGVVKAKSAGKTTITAKTVNGLTATCNITVFADNVAGNIFADIKADSWMYTPAKSVYDKGYMTGTGNLDGRVLFSPNTDMNRTMFVQALYSMDGKPDVTYVQKFSDVKESAWYAKAVTWASNNGVVAGNADGTFGINGKATREQLALMFYKYAVSKNLDVTVKPSTTLDGFNDANKVDSWALTAVKWAVERGIISGKGNASTGYRIDPIGKATRVECAAMMNKFSEIYTNAPKMSDEDLEEPLALPEEEIEDRPVPVDETEDVIIDDEEDAEDKDIPSEDETDTDEGEVDTEEEVSTDTEE